MCQRFRLATQVSRAIRALVTRQLRIHADRIPYEFDRLPVAKVLNACRVEASTYFKPSRPWGWPTHLMVEPSTLCNLTCALCPVTAGLARPQGLMEFSMFKKVIDEVGQYIFTLLLWDWGEPFTNPAVYSMIDLAARRGIKTISSTNGVPFARKDNADRAIQAGLDTLIVAVDGITQESYARYRQGGKLESALDGIRMIVARKKALGSTKPLINFRFIVMRHNEHEVPRLSEFARSLGVNALTLKTLNPSSQDMYAARDEMLKNESYLPQDRSYWRFRTDALGRRIRRKHNPCKHPWYHPSIHWNGVVCSCTYDSQERYPLGDLRQKSFHEIWLDKPYRQLRAQFRRDWNKLPLCRECSYAYEGGDCTSETIAEAIFYPEAP